MGKYDRLLEPLKLTKHMTLKNRIVKAPQATMYWNEDGTVSDRALSMYENLAAGGASMIVVGGIAWQRPPEGTVYCRMDGDKYIPGLTRFAESIHRHDCRVVAQINHLGPSARATIDGRPPFGPSDFAEEDLPSPAPHLMPSRGLSVEEMTEYRHQIVDAFVRAKKSGWDGVEVHAANGYYLASFLTDVWNKRTDEYGTQTFENRTRYVCEIIREARERLGEDYLIGIRVNGQEWGAEGRITPEIAAQIAPYLEKAGVDYISVNGYGYGPQPFKYCPDYFPYPEPEEHMKPFMDAYRHEGINAAGTVAIKHAVHIPVIAAGRMDENLAEETLEKGNADLIALGRALFADPFLPNKIMEGREDEIQHCTHCGTCEDPLTEPRICRVNPSLGHESEMALSPAEKPKSVMVIGGGAAGMEAALTLSARGHKVTLYERESELGGRIKLAEMIKYGSCEDVMPIYDHLTRMIAKSDVVVNLKTEVRIETVAKTKPDAVVIATSSPYFVPNVPGIDRKNVFTIPAMSDLARVPLKMLSPAKLSAMSEKVFPVGKRIVIIGAGAEGAQCAVFLVKRDKQVVLVAQDDDIGGMIPGRYKDRLVPWFEKVGVRIIRQAQLKEVGKKTAVIQHAAGNVEDIVCDSVMIMLPERRDPSLFEQIKAIVPEVYEIGSTLGGDNAFFKHALYDGRAIGCRI